MNILWDDVWEKYRWELLIAMAGVTIIGVGIFWWRSTRPNTESIEVLSAATVSTPSSTLMVDVSGAVRDPGVYSLRVGSRIDDALRESGGLTAAADSNWIEVNLNRAEKIRDGMKIFIPARAENVKDEASAVNIISASPQKVLLDVNAATLSQLDELKGVGPVTAQKIIDNRPYALVDDLLTKKIVSKKVFEQIKNQIRAW